MTSGLWELVLKGIWVTVQLLFLSALLATGVSFVVGIARTHRLWIVRFLAGFYTEVFRGTSALIMIFWVFFVLPPAFGWQLVPLWAGTLALGLTYGAYGAEIVRGALTAVDPAQREGGVALNFTPWQRTRKILLPQAVPEMIPPFSNLLIELLKGTALVSVMGMGDLTFSAKLVRLALQESAEIYTYILVIYFVIAFLLTRVMRRLERNLKAGLGQGPTRPSRFALRRDTAGASGVSTPTGTGTTGTAGVRAGVGGDS
ncbi:ectoine/hydroxyectoine ABC transporter permease subunit EhuC [Streptomyces sp. B3I8]|uniref:ectoine/hydroxyectoine ABC transporter permease subunit EhuC n=1 Tax=Streptomyces sp. B3I8 TaxID=3042303 RepID=UPI00278526B5|nr:ectoine/hydroxyectoine ABC transporter permease subunit EhuC [Streptomyces sp. B3I8]MDQ0787160.1 polar amino acid transport system permease protein [Streptomyces sp. B3I8]